MTASAPCPSWPPNVTTPPQSAILPLPWALPYLVSKGINVEQVRSFVGQATHLLRRGLTDEFVDASEDIERMARIFR